MEIIILLLILIGIPLGFLIDAIFLHLTTKIFKVEGARYKTALKVSAYFWLMTLVFAFFVGILFSAIKIELAGNVFLFIAGFFVANFLYKKYYQTDTKKNLKIYIVKLILSSVATLVIGLGIILPIRMFIFQPFTMEGAGMEPSLKNGQYMFFKEYDKNYQRGEIIVFRYPKDTTKFFLKRIVGLPNEKIEIKDNAVFVDGKILNESAYLGKDIKTADNASITLGNDEYFVMGDNRMFSSDSRSWGSVKKDLIVGKYWLTLDIFSE